jgi:hypothetical protein
MIIGKKYEAFSNLDQFIMPQIKTRPIETAVNRCLDGCEKGPVEYSRNFFEPDKEFIYYKTKKNCILF